MRLVGSGAGLQGNSTSHRGLNARHTSENLNHSAGELSAIGKGEVGTGGCERRRSTSGPIESTVSAAAESNGKTETRQPGKILKPHRSPQARGPWTNKEARISIPGSSREPVFVVLIVCAYSLRWTIDTRGRMSDLRPLSIFSLVSFDTGIGHLANGIYVSGNILSGRSFRSRPEPPVMVSMWSGTSSRSKCSNSCDFGSGFPSNAYRPV